MPKPLTQTTGRRKAAIARVRLRPGNGTITVNGRPVEDYFPSATHRMVLTEPLRLVEKSEDYNIDAGLWTAAASPARPAPSAWVSLGRWPSSNPSFGCR